MGCHETVSPDLVGRVQSSPKIIPEWQSGFLHSIPKDRRSDITRPSLCKWVGPPRSDGFQAMREVAQGYAGSGLSRHFSYGNTVVNAPSGLNRNPRIDRPKSGVENSTVPFRFATSGNWVDSRNAVWFPGWSVRESRCV